EEGNAIASKPITQITFANISFQYPGAEENILKDISFSAEAGEITAIIGGTGSGKTTLIQLISRLFDPSSGTICMNGHNNTDNTIDYLQQKIGYVPKQSLFLSRIVTDNIRFGYENATEEEIISAAKIAQADEFIQQLPKGYDTYIE